jgi:hypothetical protein
MNPSAAIYISVPAITRALSSYLTENLPGFMARMRAVLNAEITFCIAPNGHFTRETKAINSSPTKAKAIEKKVYSKPRKPNTWQGQVSEILSGKKLTAKEVCETLKERGEKPAYATVYSYLKRKTAFDDEAKRFYLAQ